MTRLFLKLLPLLAVAALFYAAQRDKLPSLEKLLELVHRPSVEGEPDADLPPAATDQDVIRVASFNIQVFGEDKLGTQPVVDVLVQVVRQFDVVAIQEVRAKSQDLLPRFVELVNADGSHYDFAIGPRLGRTNSKEQYAFVFDAESVEIDRANLYTIDDPSDLLHREPLVGGFRVRGVPTREAFTFTLVNIHTDPDEVAQELNVLDDVFRAVRLDGREEDDVILLGDLNADERRFGQLARVPGIAWVIYGVPTNVRGTQTYDNLLFDRHATTEFTGRGGVFDFAKEFGLSQAQALEVSDHFPVWAEFQVREGGSRGRVAGRPAAETQR